MGSLLTDCNPKFNSKSLGKIATDSVAWFTKLRNPYYCNIFGFKKSLVENARSYVSYDMKDKPDEKICGLNKCDMTGTIFVTPIAVTENTFDTKVTTDVNFNAEDFQFGYARLLVFGKAGQKLTLTFKNKSNNDGNVYDITLSETGWNVVVIELFNPDRIIGKGFIASEEGLQLIVESTTNEEFRLSTLEFFRNAYDLVRDSTFGFTCVSDFSGDPALTITEDVCTYPTYDDTATTIERSLTATNVIGELFDFGGITKRTDLSTFIIRRNGKFKTKQDTYNGKEYWSVTISDLADIDCPYFVVQPQDCAEEVLYHMNVDPSVKNVNLPHDMFFRVGNKLYFNENYKDINMIISYPRYEDGKSWDISIDELNKNTYMLEMQLPIEKDEYILKANNVLITGIPWTWTREAGTFTVPFSLAKDEKGIFGTFIKIDKSK